MLECVGWTALLAACALLALAGAAAAPACSARVVPAAPLRFPGALIHGQGRPGETDCNSPVHWSGDQLYIFNSAGDPYRATGTSILHLEPDPTPCSYDNTVSGARWIESTYRHPDGTLYGWYHNEPLGVCPDRRDLPLTAPRIGAAHSQDDGATWRDLGFVLEAPPHTLRCDTLNGYFAGGNGDFCVVVDRRRQWVVFLFSTYWDFEEQGVAVARMRHADLVAPVGKVSKWRHGRWSEPGIGGRVTPIHRASVDWHRADCDAFWGPSVHWNSHLSTYVMLLNRAIDRTWKQEGVYWSTCPTLARPEAWTRPEKLMDHAELAPAMEGAPGWYPQVVGLDPRRRETDTLAGRRARLFVHGRSRWEVLFLRPGEAP
ncbi:MAG TPA: hypothetical protein VLH79_05960 [Chthonomonadales bacterium]|nr:hypothetical protein [Chthonomonadales bacterium]